MRSWGRGGGGCSRTALHHILNHHIHVCLKVPAKPPSMERKSVWLSSSTNKHVAIRRAKRPPEMNCKPEIGYRATVASRHRSRTSSQEFEVTTTDQRSSLRSYQLKSQHTELSTLVIRILCARRPPMVSSTVRICTVDPRSLASRRIEAAAIDSR